MPPGEVDHYCFVKFLQQPHLPGGRIFNINFMFIGLTSIPKDSGIAVIIPGRFTGELTVFFHSIKAQGIIQTQRNFSDSYWVRVNLGAFKQANVFNLQIQKIEFGVS
jgi:hypothetical protein